MPVYQDGSVVSARSAHEAIGYGILRLAIRSYALVRPLLNGAGKILLSYELIEITAEVGPRCGRSCGPRSDPDGHEMMWFVGRAGGKHQTLFIVPHRISREWR